MGKRKAIAHTASCSHEAVKAHNLSIFPNMIYNSLKQFAKNLPLLSRNVELLKYVQILDEKKWSDVTKNNTLYREEQVCYLCQKFKLKRGKQSRGLEFSPK